MYARVARWEHADPGELRKAAQGMRARVDANEGPPEGVPSTGLMYLTDPDSGRCLVIGLFDTEEDLRKGDETLNRMSPPPGENMGERTSVEMYEVGVDVRAAGREPIQPR
jgi:hypothetical protein